MPILTTNWCKAGQWDAGTPSGVPEQHYTIPTRAS